MPPKVVTTRIETEEEAETRKWFSAQALESPKTLDEAARLLIGLVTALLSALFGVLTVSADKLPPYLSLPLVKISGVAAIVLWLAALLLSLWVVLPRHWRADASKPTEQKQVFAQILVHKSRWLAAAVICFGLAVLTQAIVLITALLSIK